jgi:K+-transporting ATPase KdpF subunit
MQSLTYVGGALAVALLAYLLFVMLWPEKL